MTDNTQPLANSVSAESRSRTNIEPEAASGWRERAMASIAANDKDAAPKREVIERMSVGELRLFSAAGSNRAQADDVLRAAASRLERESAALNRTQSQTSARPPLDERFNLRRRLLSKEYEFRDQPGKLAFSETFGTLRTDSNAPAAAIAMMDRAAERGWSIVRTSGSAEFQRQAWIAGTARGIEAVGYEPTKGDREAAQLEGGRLAREGAAAAKDAAKGVARPSPQVDRSAEQAWPQPSVTVAPQHASERAIVRAIEQRGELLDTAERHPGQLIPMSKLAPGVARQWADADAQDYRRLYQWPRQEEAALRITENMRASPDYQAELGRSAPELSVRVSAIANAHDARVALKDERSQGMQGPAQDRRPNERADDGRGRPAAFAGAAAVMRALDQVLEQQHVPQERRPEVRAAVSRELHSLNSAGKSARVRIIDPSAPRLSAQALPIYERQRAVAAERSR